MTYAIKLQMETLSAQIHSVRGSFWVFIMRHLKGCLSQVKDFIKYFTLNDISSKPM